MTRARWRFGNSPLPLPQDPTTPDAPVTFSADAKKFGIENVRRSIPLHVACSSYVLVWQHLVRPSHFHAALP